MTDDERTLWRTSVKHRTERLAKLVTLNAPHHVLMTELVLVMKALAGLDQEAFGTVLANFFNKSARAGMGLCTLCGAPNAQAKYGEDWCLACELQARRDNEADDAMLAALPADVRAGMGLADDEEGGPG